MNRQPPGIILGPSEQFRLIPAFRAHFRVHEPKGTIGCPGWFVPTWITFPSSAVTATPAVLKTLNLRPSTRLFFYIEDPFPGQMRRASVRDIVDHLLTIPDDEHFSGPGRYAIPEDFSWCIAYTQEYVGQERMLRLVGLLNDERPGERQTVATA